MASTRHRRSRAIPATFDARVLLDLFDEDADERTIAGALGIGRRTIREWRRGERYLINAYRADRIAIHLGSHPSLVWGREWWTTIEEDGPA